MSLTTTNLQIRVDTNLKNDAECLFFNVTLDLPAAIWLFLKQSLLKNCLLFPVARDQFYSVKNQAAFEKSIKQLNDGKIITKTIEELKIMAL